MVCVVHHTCLINTKRIQSTIAYTMATELLFLTYPSLSFSLSNSCNHFIESLRQITLTLSMRCDFSFRIRSDESLWWEWEKPKRCDVFFDLMMITKEMWRFLSIEWWWVLRLCISVLTFNMLNICNKLWHILLLLLFSVISISIYWLSTRLCLVQFSDEWDEWPKRIARYFWYLMWK